MTFRPPSAVRRGASKLLWTQNPTLARSLERLAQLAAGGSSEPAALGGAAAPPSQLSFMMAEECPCTGCQGAPERTPRPAYRHACCGRWLCSSCHDAGGPGRATACLHLPGGPGEAGREAAEALTQTQHERGEAHTAPLQQSLTGTTANEKPEQ